VGVFASIHWREENMKLIIALAASLFITSAADADGGRPAILKGKAAEDFIAKYFPKADIPGPVNGRFRYYAHGHIHVGHANCDVPAMGARSDGAVSTCTVWY
jgi:hypothetical protein